MTKRYLTGLMLALFIGGLVLSDGAQVAAQMGPGMMGPQGMMGQGQTSPMPMQQMGEVIRQMAGRLASGKGLDADKGERLRRLADQLVDASGRMSRGMSGGMMGGGMMSGGMMGQGSEQMSEVSRILAEISNLLRGQ